MTTDDYTATIRASRAILADPTTTPAMRAAAEGTIATNRALLAGVRGRACDFARRALRVDAGAQRTMLVNTALFCECYQDGVPQLGEVAVCLAALVRALGTVRDRAARHACYRAIEAAEQAEVMP